MLTVLIGNVSDLAPVSDYVYSVSVNGERISQGIVRGHRREDGWKALLKKIAEEGKEI